MSQKQAEGYLTKRDRILRYLLLNCSSSDEGCTLKEIASAVMLSPTGARHYLTTLENEGLVFLSEKKGTAGRPAMTYFLTSIGLNTFPKAYKEFSINLLEEVKAEFGEKVVIDLLESIGRKKAANMNINLTQEMVRTQLPEIVKKQIDKIINVFQENGKIPELIEDDKYFLIKNYNCLYYDIVMEEPLVCKVTETIMDEITDHMAIRVGCIREGDKSCIFKIKK
ncbi:MAG: helix-turn-helix transcriptional regulator [Candidatus Hodarchaeales archaeon]|jgi:predicted ArsR family transcriptional regulator